VVRFHGPWIPPLYDEHFLQQYGFWRPYVEQVIYRHLDAACPVPDTGDICITALPFPQRHPQHIEVPPDIEAKRIISYFSSTLSRYSNNMLLKDE